MNSSTSRGTGCSYKGNFWLTSQDANKLKLLAKAHGVSMSTFVRQLVRQAIVEAEL